MCNPSIISLIRLCENGHSVMAVVFPLLNKPLSEYTEPYKLQIRGKAQYLRLVIPPILGLRKKLEWSKWVEINSIRSLSHFPLTLGK